MQYTAAFVLAIAGFAAAQSTTTTAAPASGSAVSGCGSAVDIIINTCVATEMAQLNSCSTNDWNCLCTQWTNVLTCYNNCPADPNAFTAQQSQTSYCNAAKEYSSSSSSFTNTATASVSSSLASALSTAATGSHTGSTTVATGFATATSSTTGSASAASASASKGAGAALVAPAGFAAVLGLAAML